MAAAMTAEPKSTNRQIPILEVHDALHDEWAKLARDVEAATGEPPLHTATLTLAIVTSDKREVEAARSFVQELAHSVPSRVLFFSIDEDAEELAATVSARCAVTPKGRYGHCYDIVDVTVPQSRIGAIPNIIATHRIGELPIFTIWHGEADVRSEQFRRIADVVDRLVIDSEHFGQPLLALRDYSDFLNSGVSQCIGSDLAWSRTLTWRELIAQSFDIPAVASLAPYINRIEIAYDPGAEASAVLLSSWLLSRLEHRPVQVVKRTGTTDCTASGPPGSPAIQLSLDQSQSIGFGIRSARIQAHSGSGAARITIQRRSADRTMIRLDATGMPRQERVVHHEDGSLDELIGAELMTFRRDSIYLAALSNAAEYARLALDSSRK